MASTLHVACAIRVRVIWRRPHSLVPKRVDLIKKTEPFIWRPMVLKLLFWKSNNIIVHVCLLYATKSLKKNRKSQSFNLVFLRKINFLLLTVFKYYQRIFTPVNNNVNFRPLLIGKKLFSDFLFNFACFQSSIYIPSKNLLIYDNLIGDIHHYLCKGFTIHIL